MKSLKKVPPGAKGLRKLPTAVRNKMGYMQKGGKVTKKMVDEEFTSNMNSSMNLTNELAKRASTGLKKNGFPMKPAAAKALKKEVARRKKQEQKAKPNYRYVGTKLPAGPAPFEDDGMPKAKNGMKAVKKYGKGGKMYQKGGKVKSKKGNKVTDYGSTDLVGLDLATAERRVAQDAKYAKNSKNYGTSKYDKNIDRERVAGKRNQQAFDTSQDSKVKKLRRKDPKAYNRIKESLRAAGESTERTRQLNRKRDSMKSGGKIVKYQEGGKNSKREAAKSGASSAYADQRAIKLAEKEAYQLQVQMNNAKRRADMTGSKVGAGGPDPKLNRRLDRKEAKQDKTWEKLESELEAAQERLFDIYEKQGVPVNQRRSYRRTNDDGSYRSYKGKDGKQHYSYGPVTKPGVDPRPEEKVTYLDQKGNVIKKETRRLN